ncbi:MAG: glycosyltransferase family 2 protein [Paludibacteraceae bacterium]|nr:glycosyltransferase family 2 protein [Paludibacteraceae bacterium]
MTEFKIYSLLLVKNEADIVEACLQDACRWSDKVIVIDNGSADNTWQIVQQMAAENQKIVAFMRYEGPFHIGIRSKAFKAFKHEMTSNDWWCVRLDADEFFPSDVRQFLQSVPKKYCNIKKESTDYVLTKEDLQTLDFSLPFAQLQPHIKHYLPHKRRERRFVRHSAILFWLEKWRYPHPLGRTYPNPIPVNHYQYRSPEQMKKRYMTRQQAKNDGCGTFKHEKGNNWEDYVLTNQQLQEQFSQYLTQNK